MLEKVIKRLRRQQKVRSKISWTVVRPRLNVFRSNLNIYAQLIDDTTWTTLCSSSDLSLKISGTKNEKAQKVWEDIAKQAKEKNISEIVFDRGWFTYHGRVKALADSARENWLKF